MFLYEFAPHILTPQIQGRKNKIIKISNETI
jgi:hypothetical protein